MKAIRRKRCVLILNVFVFAFFLALTFQYALAVPGDPCTTNSDCGGYACKDNLATPAFDGKCIGPCTANSECSTVATTFGWEGTRCTGYPNECIGKGTGTQTCTLKADKSGCNNEATGGVFASCGFEKIAEGSCIEAPAYSLGTGLKEGQQLLDIVRVATNWVFAIFVILSIIFVLLAAFQFITAGADAKKVGEARQKLIWAAIGIAVALAARGLVPVMRAILGA